ncbi:MAG TPA: hypothetical protein VJN91_06075, partial [Gammaproteobacteria bacterium]|nr:hypothetical protein [Gammaproteobacteria bacterium]
SGLGQFLTRISGYIPFALTRLSSFPQSANGLSFEATIDVATTIKRWVQTWYVQTTNNASNYWTIALQEIDGTAIASFDTSAGSANVWTRRDSGEMSVSITTADMGLRINATKTGSPGDLFLAGPAVYVL